MLIGSVFFNVKFYFRIFVRFLHKSYIIEIVKKKKPVLLKQHFRGVALKNYSHILLHKHLTKQVKHSCGTFGLYKYCNLLSKTLCLFPGTFDFRLTKSKSKFWVVIDSLPQECVYAFRSTVKISCRDKVRTKSVHRCRRCNSKPIQ